MIEWKTVKIKNTESKLFDENKDWLFTIKTENGEKGTFVISHNKAGASRIELWADYDDFKMLESLIAQDPESEIIDNGTIYSRAIKYIRHGYEFSLLYIDEVDVWIDPHWDGDPFIEFGFVNKGHPDFEVYASEALRINNLLFQGRQKKKEK